MKRILFQGDSITDCRRNREDSPFHILGAGYAFMSAGKLGYDNPGEYEFINRGIGGNRITDVYARMKCDIINLKPDYMSILIGVNDVWHEVTKNDGVSEKRFEKVYDMLIKDILEELPNLKIMILEPFVLKGEATSGNWEYFNCEVRKRAEVSRKIADKYNLKFVPLQDKFDEALKIHEEPYWTIEGVHPTEKGHYIIMKEWLKAFEDIK